MNETVSAVVVCAGSSSRMNGIDKLFAQLSGVPVIARTLLAFDKTPCIGEIIAVCRPDTAQAVFSVAEKYGITKLTATVTGGKTRMESVLAGVNASSLSYVAITDGARPLVTPELITRACNAAFMYGAAAPAIRVTDTVKRVNTDGSIASTVDRSELVRIQTPQVFLRERYIELATRAKSATTAEFTDDCSVYEYFGERAMIVDGAADNIKITVRDDLDTCARLLNGGMRIGHGYDVHRLVPGRKLWLCGELIDFEMGLDGHSDADVALHALIDAMLGAAAMGDIGTLFPDNDDKYKDISSIILLKNVASRVFEKYSLGNCDVTIIAQKPKLMPHIDKMRSNIADALNVSRDSVNVKATTEEHLGFTGRLEGISAHAVCTLNSI